jgi:hypothetical protein
MGAPRGCDEEEDVVLGRARADGECGDADADATADADDVLGRADDGGCGDK